jgi:hypothetical protein
LLADRLIQDPIGERLYQVGALRDRDEFVWRHQSVFRMLPAHQCLQPHDLQGACVDFGLIVQYQLALLDRPIQLVPQHDVLPDCRLAAGVVEGDDEPVLLSHVHGRVGAVEQIGSLATMLRMERDPDAGGEPEGHSLDVQRLANAMADTTGDGERSRHVRRRGQQNRELVPTKASDDFVPAQWFS